MKNKKQDEEDIGLKKLMLFLPENYGKNKGKNRF